MSSPCCGKVSVTTVTTSYTAKSSDAVILVNNSANVTITLPAASGRSGHTYHILKISDNVYTVTIDGSGSETVNDNATLILRDYLQGIRIVCNGSEWFAITAIGAAESLHVFDDVHVDNDLYPYGKIITDRLFDGRATSTSGQIITAASQQISPSQFHKKVSTSSTDKLLTSTPSIVAGTEGQLLLITCGACLLYTSDAADE